MVNNIMDSMGAHALLTEPPCDEPLEKKPFRKTAPLINRQLVRVILGMGIHRFVTVIVLQFDGEHILNLDSSGSSKEAYKLEFSIIFSVFVVM